MVNRVSKIRVCMCLRYVLKEFLKLSPYLPTFKFQKEEQMREKKFKKRNIPKFPIHYYTKIAAKTGTHDKIILFFASKRGTVPPKEEQLASMFPWWLENVKSRSKLALFSNGRHFEIRFPKKRTITFFWGKLSKLHKKTQFCMWQLHFP